MKKHIGYLGAFLLGCGATAFIAAGPLQDHGHNHDHGHGHDHGHSHGDHAHSHGDHDHGMADMEQQMAEWMEKYGTPGPEHARFKTMAGKWNVSMKHWNYPGAEAETNTGTAEITTIFDGRFAKEHFKSDWNGVPFEGYNLLGYDRFQDQWNSIWIDSMSTAMFISKGKESGNKITFKGKHPDPMSGEMIEARMVTEHIDDDTSIFRMYKPGPDGKEYKGMEMTYRRVK